METSNIIVADLGGTYIRFAVAFCNNFKVKLFNYKKVPSKDYSSFKDALSHYMDFLINEKMQAPRHGCFAVAGPVSSDGCSKLTNLSWFVSPNEIIDSSLFDQVKIINDVEAFAYSIPSLSDSSFIEVKKGCFDEKTDCTVVISIGTGFGSSLYVPHKDFVISSESGNSVLGSYTDLQFELLSMLRKDINPPLIEDFFSGRGLFLFYQKWCALHNYRVSYDNLFDFFQALRSSQMDMVGLVDAYLSWFSSIAADICLHSGARRLILGGSLLNQLSYCSDISSCFNNGFVYSKSMGHLQKEISVFLCENESLPLVGAANFFRSFA